MLPAIEGIIARRILLNFRADPAVVRRVVPEPLGIAQVNGHAVVGVCLIRLERVRPRGLPQAVGFASENMAHRFAVTIENGDERPRDGVYIARRDTDSCFVSLLGGRLFPGYHHAATFDVSEDERRLEMDIRTESGVADVRLDARFANRWPGSGLFSDLAEASAFFARGACGYSCGRDGHTLEGVELRTLKWSVEPLDVACVRSAYFSDTGRFPEGSIQFDHGLLMRGIPHEWHELRDVPELASDFSAA